MLCSVRGCGGCVRGCLGVLGVGVLWVGGVVGGVVWCVMGLWGLVGCCRYGWVCVGWGNAPRVGN